MASCASIDIEDATQHLRDILKLDRPAGGTTAESQRPPSTYNGDLNGLLVPEPLSSGDRTSTNKPGLRTMPPINLQEKQVICLSGDDSSTCIGILAKEVEIVASSDSSISSKARGSNKVKIQPVAKYDWEQKYYYGNLIAVSNSFLAYAIRAANNGSAMVRVISVSTSERTLLKGFTGSVADLAFAHLNSPQLACLDEAGNLFVWRLALVNGKIQEEILVHIRQPEGASLNQFRRIIWCPFIPEESEDCCEESSPMVALLHEDRAEVWDLEMLRSSHNTWPVDVSQIKQGFIVVKGHSTCLSEGALSPDGTVLATASHDGYVKFWQIYIEGQDEPRCLHEWKPHDGRPLSCLLFCDNHKKQDPEVPFWRFLITGADQNRELKMWCTVSWTCLQTIRFSPDIFSSVSVPPSLKVCLDLSAEYLILSDVQRKVLYVMELLQNQEEGRACFSSISEFLLTHPVLSFGIQVVSRCRLRHTEVLPAEEENDSLGAENSHGAGAVESAAGVLIKLFCVHTKALQDVQIRFQPQLNPDVVAPLPTHTAHEDFTFGESRPELSNEGLGSAAHGSQSDLRRIVELPAPADFLSLSNETKPKLMTPDAFMTPTASLQQITTSPGSSSNSSSSSSSSLTAVSAVSSTSAVDPSLSSLPASRPPEELTLSPKLQLDSSLTMSSSSLQTSPRSLLPGLLPGPADKLTPKGPGQVSTAASALSVELQEVEPLGLPQASPSRTRSPDVISSASTALSQDIPEIASEALSRGFGSSAAEGLEPDSMASAASALHLLSPRPRAGPELGSQLGLEGGPGDGDRHSTPSLLEAALTQEAATPDSQVWPTAPDITRETCSTLAESPRNGLQEKHKSLAFHRLPYHLLQQHDSQDTSAEQSDHDDEVASLASASGGFSAKIPTPRLPAKDWKTKGSPRSSPKLKRKSKKDDGDSAVGSRLTEHHVVEPPEDWPALIWQQQRELAELRHSQEELLQRLCAQLEGLQSTVTGHVERALETRHEQEQRRLERALAEGQQRGGQLQEQLTQQMSQALSSAVAGRLERSIREEIKKTVPPCVSRSLEPVAGQLSNSVATKLTAVEGSMKENISKLLKSKNLTDAIARAAADTLQGPMQAAYREAFQSVVLPAFEKSCQAMFQQINDSFRLGTQEYLQQLESHMKSRKAREQEAREPVLAQLRGLVSTLQSATEQMVATVSSSVRAEVQHQLHLAVGSLQESILAQVQRIVKGEVSVALKEQQATVTSSIMQAMRSAAGTPVPSAHLDCQAQQAHILQLLQQGHLNQAFQQALTAADLNLVLYVCETVDPAQVFGQPPCPLSQPVLLSLIQQLASDLGTRTDLKLSYLEEAVMHLDHSDPITRDHMGSVMAQVRQKLFQFLQAEPHNSLGKAARRLSLMLHGLVTPSLP
ncbi:enhancer of mRNA-decapping protein 4 isoform X1 [Dipodomys spectabilis]|uniref:enhancer of mRNA-decapping protein 4 isoform X1 n=1 Tax=Dipodomys spectabilis TaxID=105255 RepID=UPI001C54877D|nr:enhancer of mRNA-decapping protein 4 isoform X1 [Dipodomys spectabilis]XP_042556681.1 enhancer of mRNA-decapping protein 4 isoform X1 [Dipodomys spectabilis]